ncbi:MAG: DUF934 domain-containing protein [Gammaproteobacteria bacterium]|nr:DUF934 domain-containing protein [Gammaproteobacteria bacterium]
MPLIRNREIVPDRWRAMIESTQVADLGPGDVIVNVALLEQAHDALLTREGRLGVRLPPHHPLQALDAGMLRGVSLVELEFSTHAEGRGYSQARLLRARLGYEGDIRAVGDVSRERLAFMARCGVNEFLLPDNRSAEDALSAFSEISLVYQPGVDGAHVIPMLRGWRASAGAVG